jgi:hypothetical protein
MSNHFGSFDSTQDRFSILDFGFSIVGDFRFWIVDFGLESIGHRFIIPALRAGGAEGLKIRSKLAYTFRWESRGSVAMAKIRVMFHKCLRAEPQSGTDDEPTSRLYFSLETKGKRYDGFYADVRQTPGTLYESGSVEVSAPKGAPYTGPFNYDIYRYAAAKYYRNLLRRGIAFRQRPGAPIRKNEVKCPAVVEFDATGPEVSWEESDSSS